MGSLHGIEVFGIRRSLLLILVHLEVRWQLWISPIRLTKDLLDGAPTGNPYLVYTD